MPSIPEIGTAAQSQASSSAVPSPSPVPVLHRQYIPARQVVAAPAILTATPALAGPVATAVVAAVAALAAHKLENCPPCLFSLHFLTDLAPSFFFPFSVIYLFFCSANSMPPR